MNSGKTYKYRDIEYTLVRSRRKTCGLHVGHDGRIEVRAPLYYTAGAAEEAVASKYGWLKKTLEKIRKSVETASDMGAISPEEVKSLAELALDVIPGRVRYYAGIAGVTYGRITIRNQVSRWGSCSAAGNLNFNCLLMLAPTEVLDSVIVHELCHRKEMNHSAAFYAEVRRVFPEYDRWHKWLKVNGPVLLKRMRAGYETCD